MRLFQLFVLLSCFFTSEDLLAQDSLVASSYFKQANSDLMETENDGNRIVLMGNSITQGWPDQHPDFFYDSPYINRGISGQTTSEMLLRFQQDVIDLEPSIVVILAGTNDIAQNRGPVTIDQIAQNIFSMVEMSQEKNIEVVLCSVLPAYQFPWRPQLEPAEQVLALNEQLRTYAEEQQIVYVDYHTAMMNDVHGMKEELAYDGIHPNTAGYLVMEPLLEAGITSILDQQ